MKKLLFILFLLPLFAKAQTEGSLFTQSVASAGDMRCFFPNGWSTASASKKVLVYHWGGTGSTTIGNLEGEYPLKKIVDGWNGKKVIGVGDTVYYAFVSTVYGNTNCNNAVRHSDYIWSNWLQADSTSMMAGYRVVFSGYSGGGGEMSKPLTGFCFGGEAWDRVQTRYRKYITSATGAWQDVYNLSTVIGKACYWGFVDVDDALANNTTDVHTELLTSPGATAYSVKKTNPVLSGDGHGVIDDYTWDDRTNASDDAIWWAYDTLYGIGPAPARCSTALQTIPVSEYMFYDLSGAGGFNSLFKHNSGGGTRIDQMTRVGGTPWVTPVMTGYGKTMPVQNIGINRKYFQDGGMVKWIDFRQKWYIDEVYYLDSSYFNNWFQVWMLDSTNFYQQISNPDTSTAQINVRGTNYAGSGAWVSTTGLTDSARFMMLRFVRSNNDITGDSFPDIRQIIFRGCPVGSMTFADSTLKPTMVKAPEEFRKRNGANFSFGGNDSLIRYQARQRKYYARSTSTYNINYPSTDSNGVHPTEKWNLLSAANDSFQFVARGNYPYWVLVGPTAGAMKKLKASGESAGHYDTWTPVDDAGLNYKDTASYTSIREFSRQVALTYGTGGLQLASTLTPLTEDQRYINRNNLWGIQDGNEDNKWWFGRYESPMVYTAKAWAINKGIRTSNSTFKQVMSGVAWDPEWMRSVLYLEKLYNGSIFHTDVSMHYYDNNYKYTNYPIDPSDASMVGLESYARNPEIYGKQWDTLEYFIRREARYDTTFSTNIGEFGTDKLTLSHGRFAVGASDDANGYSMYGNTRYKNLAGTVYDSITSHGIRNFRERLLLMFSPIAWSAYFSFDDYDTEANKPITGGNARYFGSYVNSGMWNGYDNRKMALWWMETNFMNRFGDYVKDSIYSYGASGGVMAMRAHHKTITDSILVIVWENDTTTHNVAYAVPAQNAAAAVVTTLNMTTWGFSNSSATIGGDNDIDVLTDVIPQFYTFLKTAGSNADPISDAGADQTINLPTSSVTVNGSGSSDPDGTITTYAWTRISGPNTPTITTASNVSTSITGLIAGVYVFRLTVTDNLGATDTDDVQITVNAAVVLPFIRSRFRWKN